MRDVIASLFEVGIDPMFVIRCEDSASDRGRHAELTVLRLGRLALSVERSTTDIAPGCDGAGLRFARNPGSRKVNAARPCKKRKVAEPVAAGDDLSAAHDRPPRQIISSG